jgi:hypothetical protein
MTDRKFGDQFKSLEEVEAFLISDTADSFVQALELGGWKIVSTTEPDASFPTKLPRHLAPWWTVTPEGPGEFPSDDDIDDIVEEPG